MKMFVRSGVDGVGVRDSVPVAVLIVLGWCIGCVSESASAAAPSSWPGWRGPRGDGHSIETDLPIRWSKDSVAWSVALPGHGQSSATIWGERVFLTASLASGKQRVVLCVDRTTHKIVWQHTAFTGPALPTHSMNGYASASCVTDGEFVYAFFGEGGGIHCYRVDGTPAWRKPIGVFDNRWGSASCPVLVGKSVIQLVDSDNQAYIAAFDRKTGRQLWRTDRDNFRGWSTPVLIRAGGHDELVVNGHAAVCAYDPSTGEELWRVKNATGRGTPTVTPAGGLLFTSNGTRPYLTAIRPGGSGDVSTSHVAWQVQRMGRDIPSPIVIGNYVLIVGLRGGILGCYDTKTGKQLWLERLGTNFSASPVAWNGHAFFLNEAGETFVVKPGARPEIVSRNRMEAPAEEIFRASITPLDGRVYIRSNNRLYCLEKSRGE